VTRRLVLVDGDVIGRQRTGDESYTLGLLRELPGAAPDLAFACSVREPHAVPGDVPAEVERITLAVASPYRRIPRAFPRLARERGAALAHVQYFVARRLPCPAVVTVHDLSFARAPELMRTRDRLLFERFVPPSLRRARRVIAVSETTRRDLLEVYGVAPERVVAVPNGVGTRFQPVADARAEVERRFALAEPYLLFVGALQPRKNAPALVAAYARLVRKGAEPLLVLAGNDRGGGDQVRAAIADYGLEARVRLLGYVSEPDLPALYSAAEALVFPSLYEGFGIPALEAMACGVPVAASSTTGLGEAVGDAAVTFDPSSVGAIAEAVERLLDDVSLRQRLRAEGLARAAEFTWRRAAEQTAAVYRDAL
jgi:alpha-1,3-rhamnosyl/mannosyltransferase